MRRRDFIAGLGSAATWPLVARAQQPTLPLVGYVFSGSVVGSAMAQFRGGLEGEGFVEGRNVAVEYHWVEYDRLPQMIGDLIKHNAKVIASVGSPATFAAKSLVKAIPIVFIIGVDPVRAGLVASLSRPGGNLTGATSLAIEIGTKRLEMLHRLTPTATAFAVLVNPNRSTAAQEIEELQKAARALKVQLKELQASTEHDIDTVFPTIVELGVGGLIISGDPFFNTQMNLLGALSVRYRVPAIYQDRPFAAGGGLLSYGTSNNELSRLQGAYVGRVLKGEKPADLPVQQSTKIELFVNLKTAKTLGLEIPPTLLAIADEVIE